VRPRCPTGRALALLAILAIFAVLVADGCSTIERVPGLGGLARPPDVGTASYYGMRHRGMRTASGERYDPRALTAAHPSLPFDTRVEVTNLDNGRSVVVRVNDRGPFVPGRIIDLSLAAARAIGMVEDGTARVRVRPVR
jgi:peptidoglycan lytic transglycosylase